MSDDQQLPARNERDQEQAAERSDQAPRPEGRERSERSPRSDDRRRSSPPRRGGGRERRGGRRRGKVCQFCAEPDRIINYKDVSLLRRYLSERGRILPRRRTGTCAKHQRALSKAIKRARHIALLPYTAEHVRLSSGS